MGLVNPSPTSFQAILFREPIVQVAALEVGVLYTACGSNPSVLRESPGDADSLLTVWHHVGDGVDGKSVSQPLLPISMWVFSKFPNIKVTQQFLFLSEGSAPYVTHMSMGEMKFISFLCCHLGPDYTCISGSY